MKRFICIKKDKKLNSILLNEGYKIKEILRFPIGGRLFTYSVSFDLSKNFEISLYIEKDKITFMSISWNKKNTSHLFGEVNEIDLINLSSKKITENVEIQKSFFKNKVILTNESVTKSNTSGMTVIVFEIKNTSNDWDIQKDYELINLLYLLKLEEKNLEATKAVSKFIHESKTDFYINVKNNSKKLKDIKNICNSSECKNNIYELLKLNYSD